MYENKFVLRNIMNKKKRILKCLIQESASILEDFCFLKMFLKIQF